METTHRWTPTDAEKEEARRIIAVQASTLPKPNEDGLIDIGQTGAWERAQGSLDANGRRVADRIPGPMFGTRSTRS